MNFSEYFEPFDLSVYPALLPVHGSLGEKVQQVSDLSEILLGGYKLVVIGVPEGRNAINNHGCGDAPDKVRRQLYSLYPDECAPDIADIGNLVHCSSPEETYYKLQEVVETLLKSDLFPIIIGGGNELGYIQYKAYASLEQMVTLVSADSGFDFGHLGGPFNSQSYTERIITDEPTHLYTYGNIGYQSYYTDPEIIRMMEKLNFDIHRLGNARGNIDHLEPVLRNADLLLVDISVVKGSDAPANGNASPNGLYAKEACKLMKYAGMSDKLSSLGMYEYNPLLDPTGITAKLVAQMLWCFIEGYYNRKGDYPIGDVKNYQKFIVETTRNEEPFVFYKSNKSGRWWIEAPKTGAYAHHNHRQRLVPCNYADYEMASRDVVPDTWWAHMLKS
ncbi:MAG: formimidoylglutamase [Bacteroidota bacterium]